MNFEEACITNNCLLFKDSWVRLRKVTSCDEYQECAVVSGVLLHVLLHYCTEPIPHMIYECMKSLELSSAQQDCIYVIKRVKTVQFYIYWPLNFQHHYSSVQYHMILQKSSWYADLLLKKVFWLLSQCWKQLCFFVETFVLYSFVNITLFFLHFFLSFCNFINAFTVRYDQFNGFLLNKKNIYKKKKKIKIFEQ